MLAALFETVVNLMQAGIMTIFTVMNALMHLRALMFMNVGHMGSFRLGLLLAWE